MTQLTDARIDELVTEEFPSVAGHSHKQWLEDIARPIARLIEREVAAWNRRPDAGAPDAWMWQHEETGNVGFVDHWQVEHGWQAANPRLRLVRALVAAPLPPPPITEQPE